MLFEVPSTPDSPVEGAFQPAIYTVSLSSIGDDD